MLPARLARTVRMCSRQPAALCVCSTRGQQRLRSVDLRHLPLSNVPPDLSCFCARRRCAGEASMLTAGGRCNPCVTPESAVSASPVQTASRKHTRETGTFICPIDGELLRRWLFASDAAKPQPLPQLPVRSLPKLTKSAVSPFVACISGYCSQAHHSRLFRGFVLTLVATRRRWWLQ